MGAKVLKIAITAKEESLILYLFGKRFGFLMEKVYLCSRLEQIALDRRTCSSVG
jgi:hypothetical protein